MKKAVIMVEDHGTYTEGQVISIGEASEIDAWNNTLTNNLLAIKIKVPVELEELPTSQLKGVKVAHQSESWSKNGEVTVYDNPLDETYTYNPSIPEHYEIQKGDGFVAYDKNRRISEKFALLNTSVGAEMKQVYNTTNPDSAVANYLTWLAMKNNPTKFNGKNLVARFDVVGLTVGDALDTEQKITDYATALIDLADDYAIWREQQILNYVVEKGQIEAE